MAKEWIPTDEQKNGVISRTCEFITDEAQELIEELNCPPIYVADMLRTIAENIGRSRDSDGN